MGLNCVHKGGGDTTIASLLATAPANSFVHMNVCTFYDHDGVRQRPYAEMGKDVLNNHVKGEATESARGVTPGKETGMIKCCES